MLELFLEILLKDQTTGKNIIWANDGENKFKEIQLVDVEEIIPRHEKIREQQKMRTRARAEIFTPPEICKLQNDLIEPKKNNWQDYIDAKVLEIACGEAPYLVNRYNAVTGEFIEIENRTGLLDRKLKMVGKETSSNANADWINFAVRAVQSVYGYEFQGDNLFLARRNIFETFKDYYREKFSKEPPEDVLFFVANIISCNLWQMDGLTGSPPFQKNVDLFGGANCKIINWLTGEVVEFISLTKGAKP